MTYSHTRSKPKASCSNIPLFPPRRPEQGRPGLSRAGLGRAGLGRAGLSTEADQISALFNIYTVPLHFFCPEQPLPSPDQPPASASCATVTHFCNRPCLPHARQKQTRSASCATFTHFCYTLPAQSSPFPAQISPHGSASCATVTHLCNCQCLHHLSQKQARSASCATVTHLDYISPWPVQTLRNPFPSLLARARVA